MKRLVSIECIGFLRNIASSMSADQCYVECGVWRGYSAARVGEVLRENPMWLFDSFCGMPSPSDTDMTVKKHRKAKQMPNYGMPAVADGLDLTRTMRLLAKSGVDLQRVNIISGWFENTFPLVHHRVGSIGLLFLDCDWYSSVKLSLETWWPKVQCGGIVVIHDYGHWDGCRIATDEFCQEHQLDVTQIDKTAVWIRKS